MDRLIRELRRRKVLSSLGLYVGICWLAIQGASIMLPVFEAPGWGYEAFLALRPEGGVLVDDARARLNDRARQL